MYGAGDDRCRMVLHGGGVGNYQGYSSYNYGDQYGYGGPGGAYPYQAPRWVLSLYLYRIFSNRSKVKDFENSHDYLQLQS